MGIIKAVFSAMGGGLADAWQEVLEADNMSDTTVFTRGVKVRSGDKRNSNKKGTQDTISNGSIIHVYDNQFMLLVDGGKVVDFTAEPGYYKVDNSTMPSLFAGQFGDMLKETFSRVKYGGVPSTSQKAYFINLQEIKGIKFGTRTPVNYFDNFYNSELFLRAFGTYSIRVTDPLKFYAEAIPRNCDRVDITDINEQYLSEFLEAFQAAINKMSVDGIRISHVPSKSRELSQYMATELDEGFRNMRGFEIQSVGIASVSYDEESKKLINMRNQGAMLGDAAVREGYVQGAMARGFEAAGSNANGSATAFMGMGMGMNAAGGFGAFSETNRAQMQQQQQQAAKAAPAGGWTCACGAVNTGKFCGECGAKKPEAAGSWTCGCGHVNTGKFCAECGAKRPESDNWFCTDCGTKNTGKFCANCGKKKD
ncbi:MAG: SPFH domain-containing protein [Clostridia bacterium]|nr:SPFH domain-containing protein [Clostridia bacterium]